MPGMRNPRLKNRLADVCQRRGITLYRLASEIGVKPHTLTQIARGVNGMSDDVLVRCCDALECGVEEILEIEPKAAVVH